MSAAMAALLMATSTAQAVELDITKYKDFEVLPDSILFFSGKTYPPPPISGNISYDELLSDIKAKKVKQVDINRTFDQGLVYYKDGSFKLSPIKGESSKETRDLTKAKRCDVDLTLISDFSKPWPVEALPPHIYDELKPGQNQEFQVDLSKLSAPVYPNAKS